MENIKVSFIIPLFNGEKFIGKCLDSLLTQDISPDEFEIICVDDCSKDDTVTIVEYYCKKYQNVKLIQHSSNLKTGSTCNTGVKNAKGEYIWIIGQDDWINNNCLLKVYSICAENRLDVLAFNYTRVNELEKPLHSAQVFNDEPVQKGDYFISTNFKDTFQYYLLGYEWRALFNREYLIKNAISFPDGAIYEDTTYLFRAILFADRFMSIADFIYNYRVNTLSITDVNKKYSGNLIYEFAFVAGNEVLELSEQIQTQYKDFADTLRDKANWYFQSFTYKILPASLREKRIFYDLIRNNKTTIKRLVANTNWYVKVLADPTWGMLLSTILKPAYLLKQKIKYLKKPRQEWSY